MYNQTQGQMNGQQYEKNPNGGYVNRSNYGQDSWYGAITITPELLAEIQRTGKVLIEVKDIQTTQYGECRRTVAKPYTPKDGVQQVQSQHVQAQQAYAPPQQAYAPQQPAYAPAQPVQTAPAPAPHVQHSAPPVHNGALIAPDPLADEIPF